MSDPLGTDLSALPDLSLSIRSGIAVLAEALARRLQTPRGSLFYAPGYGTDVREMLLAKVGPQTLFAWKAAIEQECLQDDRVEEVQAELTFDSASATLLIEIEAQTGEGPFALTLRASDVTVEVLGGTPAASSRTASVLDGAGGLY